MGRVGEKGMVNAKVLFFALFSDFPENLLWVNAQEEKKWFWTAKYVRPCVRLFGVDLSFDKMYIFVELKSSIAALVCV